MFAAIMSWTQENRVAKYAPFDTEQEAVDHIATHVSNYPDAFVVQTTEKDTGLWLIDPVAKTISISEPQERIDKREADEARAIKDAAYEDDTQRKTFWDNVDSMTKDEFVAFVGGFITDQATAKMAIIRLALEIARLRRG